MNASLDYHQLRSYHETQLTSFRARWPIYASRCPRSSDATTHKSAGLPRDLGLTLSGRTSRGHFFTPGPRWWKEFSSGLKLASIEIFIRFVERRASRLLKETVAAATVLVVICRSPMHGISWEKAVFIVAQHNTEVQKCPAYAPTWKVT